jgi:hypothetical protein
MFCLHFANSGETNEDSSPTTSETTVKNIRGLTASIAVSLRLTAVCHIELRDPVEGVANRHRLELIRAAICPLEMTTPKIYRALPALSHSCSRIA